MIRLLARSAVAAVSLTAVLALVRAAPASAHERRTVGAYVFVVGWGDEPAFTGFKNSVQVTVTEAGSGNPVTDIGDLLAVELIKGADRTKMPMVDNFRVGAFGTPGDYRAYLTPTRPGSYTFRFTGAIRGQTLDESFTSSRTTFNDVDDVANSEFPAKDPSTGQLASRIDREVPRLEASLRKAEDEAASARTLALVGLAVGALGLLASAGAMVVVRRNGARDGAPDATGSKAHPGQPESLAR